MSFFTLLLMPLVVGIVAFFVAPLFVSAIDRKGGRHLGSFYLELMHVLLGSVVLLWREDSRPRIKKLGFDGELGVHRIKLGSRFEHLEDPKNYLGRWHNRPFGIAIEDPGVIITPRLADIARRIGDLYRRDEFYANSPGGPEPSRRLHVGIPRRRKALCNPWHAKKIVRGSGDASVVDRIGTHAKNSQQPFYSTPTFQYLTLLFALGAGAGLVYLGAYIGQDVSAGSLPDAPNIGIGGTIIPPGAFDLLGVVV